MKVFDTSILVALFCAWHQDHLACLQAWQVALDESEIVLSAHSLVECYAVLTRLPPPHRLSAATSHQLIEANLRDKKLITLSVEDYWCVLRDCCDTQIAGGTIYDALIVKAAQVAGSRTIVTLNSKHFRRLAPDSIAVVAPEP